MTLWLGAFSESLFRVSDAKKTIIVDQKLQKAVSLGT